MPDWLSSVLPIVTSTFLALLAAFTGLSSLTSRRLRADLTEELNIVKSLRGKAKRELEEDIRVKSVKLSSINRSPVFIPFDYIVLVYSLLGVVLCIFAGTVFTLHRKEAFQSSIFIFISLLSILSVVAWQLFQFSWFTRYKDRHKFISDRAAFYRRQLPSIDALTFVSMMTGIFLTVLFFATLEYLYVLDSTLAKSGRWETIIVVQVIILSGLSTIFLFVAFRQTLPEIYDGK